MINAMSSGMMPPPPRTGTEQNLTEDQQSLITETLSQYDVENLTEADALSIVEAFSEAGIQPGLALEKAVSSSFFMSDLHCNSVMNRQSNNIINNTLKHYLFQHLTFCIHSLFRPTLINR